MNDPRGWQAAALTIYTENPWIKPSEADIAWCAGLYEGEGCVVNPPKGSIYLRVSMSDRDVLVLLRKRSGMGIISGPHKPTGIGSKPWYMWRANGREAVLLADAMYHYLGSRRKNQLTAKIELWLQRPRRKVNNSDLPAILKRRAKGETYKSIGESYGVGFARIWQIVNAPRGAAA